MANEFSPAGDALPNSRTIERVLFALALFAFVWIVHRAIVQSITLDEADTFIHWVGPKEPSHWEPHSNNHVLNSTLMRLCIWLFGLSHLAMRTPALMGGLLYIFSMYRCCTLFTRNATLGAALFLCIVYNPFIMDYLVAARGYGLGLGFLSYAMYTLMRLLFRSSEELTEQDVVKGAALISTCTGLTICSNFAFSIVVSVFTVISGIWATAWLRREPRPLTTWARVSAWLALPALVTTLVLAGSALTDFPRDQLFWGTDSLRETFREMGRSFFTEINPYLVNPLLNRTFSGSGYTVINLAAATCVIYVALILYALRRQGRPWQPNEEARILGAASLASIVIIALTCHWIQFKLLRIPLPLERTSIWIVPLVTASVGLIFSLTPSGLIQSTVRAVGISSLLMLGLYFAGELRDSFFNMWRTSAEVRAAYPTIQDLCRRRNVTEVASGFNLTPSLKFYNLFYKSAQPNFSNFDKMPSDKIIYVLEESQFGEFIRNEGLRVVFRGTVSDLVVLERPE